MHVEFLVEERSVEVALGNLLPKMLPEGCGYRIHTFQGKPDLLKSLPHRLRGYAQWLPEDWRIVVLVDEDRQNCRDLKGSLEHAALDAGLHTKAKRHAGFQVLNRIVVEELEAWLLGDIEALVAAYPGVPGTLGSKRGYRDPDAIGGGTWEALARALRQAGYYRSSFPKIEVARRVSAHMDPARNRSRSFRHFVAGLEALTT